MDSETGTPHSTPLTQPNQPPLFAFKPHITYTPKTSRPKKSKKTKNSTPKSTPVQTANQNNITISPSTPKKRKYHQHHHQKIINNFYGVDHNQTKKVDKINQTPPLGQDLTIRKPKLKSTGFQYYSQGKAPIDPNFYFERFQDQTMNLNRIFEELLESDSIMDGKDDGEIIQKLQIIFNKKYFLDDRTFIRNLRNPLTFEFSVWTRFLLDQDRRLCESNDFFESLVNHRLILNFREKFFHDDMDRFLTD